MKGGRPPSDAGIAQIDTRRGRLYSATVAGFGPHATVDGMPTYDYQCGKCGHRFEVFQRMNDRPKRTCPECKGRVRRLIGTGAGLLFKGSGFYITDYRSDSYRTAAKADVAPAASTAKPADGGKTGKAAKKSTPTAGKA